MSTVNPYSDAGCAALPLALLGAPVNIGRPGSRETRARSLGVAKTEDLGAALPEQDRMWPFGIIGVMTRYIPTGALGELA
jgi:hypothetical protein